MRFCAADRINSCFPVELEHLYCYESASYLHLGGYAKFVDCGTRVIQNCLSAIQNSSKTAAPKWEKIKASYLNQWGAISSNSDKVKTICDAACKLIRSPTLGEPYINFVAEHCDDRSAKELKMLIVETAIRLALIEDAKEKIGSKLEEVFSNLAAFETSLSGKKGGNTPE